MRTLFTATWVLPIVAPPIADGAVLVDGRTIAWVGPRCEAPVEDHAIRVVSLGDAILMPGLVNVHTHLELTGLRGFLEGLDFRDWLRTLTVVRRDLLTDDDLLDASFVGGYEALRHGITTVADTTDSAQPLHAMRALGLRGIGYVEVFGPDPAQCAASMAQLRSRVDALRCDDTALVRTGVSPHAPYTVSAPLYAATAHYAREAGLPIAVHIAESPAETQFVREGGGPFAERLRARGIPVAPQARSPIALLAATGVLDEAPLCIHAIQVDATDLAQMASAGARIAHCPISNAKLGHGIAPLEAMRAAGIPIGLGTDSVASNDRMHLIDEARQAVLGHALGSGVPDSLRAHEALELATRGGARALGWHDRIGTLEPGKAADLAAFPLTEEAHPVFDPAVTLVHVLAGRARASWVLVDGQVLVQDGRVLGEEAQRITRVRQVGARLQQWRQHSLPM
jgi:5-methylthioadenosine/S-adenosylhomocysteine deaminase